MKFYVTNVVSPQCDPRETMNSHNESRPIQLPSTPVISHSDGNHKYKRGLSHVPEHCCHRSEAVQVIGEEYGGGIQSRPPFGEGEIGHRSIATSEGRGRMTDFSDEAEVSDSRSKENFELVYVDPLHPQRALRIRANLMTDDKVRIKDFLSNNLDVFSSPP